MKKLLLALTIISALGTYAQEMVVNVSVTNLMRTPNRNKNTTVIPGKGFKSNYQQETQLLYGEKVRAMGEKHTDEDKNVWIRIEALEQEIFKQETWRPYPGWVEEKHLSKEPYYKTNLAVEHPWVKIYKNCSLESSILVEVSFGTKLKGIEKKDGWWVVELVDGTIGAIPEYKVNYLPDCKNLDNLTLRILFISYATMFLNTPYALGGRSAYNPMVRGQLTGADCSSLIDLCLRVLNISIPRDAHDQYLRSTPCKSLKPGDLVFSSDLEAYNRPHRIDHVQIYLGDDKLLSGDGHVRHTIIEMSQEKFGRPISEISNGENIGKYIVHFGTYF